MMRKTNKTALVLMDAFFKLLRSPASFSLSLSLSLWQVVSMKKNRQKIFKKGENRQNTILIKISFKIRSSILSTKVGDGGASPTTKVYEFWVFYHQSVQILGFLPPKCTNFFFF